MIDRATVAYLMSEFGGVAAIDVTSAEIDIAQESGGRFKFSVPSNATILIISDNENGGKVNE